jgi:prevent-host-death family protein
MEIVNSAEARKHLSRLLKRVELGEEFIVTRNGKPIARLLPIKMKERVPGALRGRIAMSDDFDDVLPTELREAFGLDL